VILGLFLVLLATGFPVAFCLLFTFIIILFLVKPAAINALATIIYSVTTTDYLIAIPMFILMACVLEFSGLGTAMYAMMYKWMAGLRGGLAMGTILISTVIAAMTGAAATATITMGMLAYPEMRNRGYDRHIAIGSITAGGCLGPLIPPSITMIVIASLGSLSIGKLFFAGVFPGLLTSLVFQLYIGLRCFRNPSLGPPIPANERASWTEKFASLSGAGPPIVLIFLVLGLIYLGVATPSEAGGIGALGSLACAAMYGTLSWKNLKNALLVTLRVTSMVFWLMIGGSVFNTLLGVTGVTDLILKILGGVALDPWIVLVIMLGIGYILGMFIETTAICIITVPLFMPVVRALGFDPLWFGLIYVMDLLIGLITPPFGLNLFYFKGLGHRDVTMANIYWAVLPFIVAMTGAWIICILFPQIALWLPARMIK